MGAFVYVALDTKGREQKGVLEGDTPRQVRQQLREQGLTPLEVSEAAAR
ncbi:MAG TPA: type II secretion system protein GspF, partial [Gammaproteobacteria bacterium]